jgi:hypothetical protein
MTGPTTGHVQPTVVEAPRATGVVQRPSTGRTATRIRTTTRTV